MDFKNLYDDAMAKASPHWEAASTAEDEARKVEANLKEVNTKLRALDRMNGKSSDLFEAENGKDHTRMTLEAEQSELNRQILERREFAKDQQAKGDSIYWPIYNLDLKNPNQAEALEHLPPEKLVDSIIKKEERILEIMREIKDIIGSNVNV